MEIRLKTVVRYGLFGVFLHFSLAAGRLFVPFAYFAGAPGRENQVAYFADLARRRHTPTLQTALDFDALAYFADLA